MSLFIESIEWKDIPIINNKLKLCSSIHIYAFFDNIEIKSESMSYFDMQIVENYLDQLIIYISNCMFDKSNDLYVINKKILLNNTIFWEVLDADITFINEMEYNTVTVKQHELIGELKFKFKCVYSWH